MTTRSSHRLQFLLAFWVTLWHYILMTPLLVLHTMWVMRHLACHPSIRSVLLWVCLFVFSPFTCLTYALLGSNLMFNSQFCHWIQTTLEVGVKVFGYHFTQPLSAAAAYLRGTSHTVLQYWVDLYVLWSVSWQQNPICVWYLRISKWNGFRKVSECNYDGLLGVFRNESLMMVLIQSVGGLRLVQYITSLRSPVAPVHAKSTGKSNIV